ncbi:MAG: Holliday junction branch migration protein RuvA [Proteobacteria bacterium]|nr:Holliday junction branch migration protein RuvA [Pseudomonadota bacterium]
MAEVPSEGSPVRIFCHTHVREDALQLFGFCQDLERRTFELLISVSGVGPRLALTILSGMPVAELLQAIAGADVRRLQTLPGVGKKTAERLSLELKERCARLGAAKTAASPTGTASARVDVTEALVALGYRRAQAERAVETVLADRTEGAAAVVAERLLRDALSLIAEL